MVHMTCVNKSPTIPECDDSDLEARVEALEECCEEVHTELDNKADTDDVNTELESIRAELNTLIAGWHYVGEVEDEESLPTTLTEGEVYYSLEDNGFYVAVSDDPNNGWRFISGVKSAITPIHLEDGVISHDDSGVTAGTYGDTTNQTPDFGETFKAVSATVDSKGHVTSISEHTVELPDPYDLYDTKCGDIVTIDDAEAARVKSLTVSLSPVQDLNGYDKPWGGGAGKNKFNGADVTTTNSSNWGVVWDDSTNVLTITHKTSYTAGAPSFPLNLPNGTYVASFASQTKVASISLYTNGSYADILSNGATFTISSGNTYEVRFNADEGTPNVITKFQIESGSTATAFAPYSNICPITGHDTLNSHVTGVNVWDEEWENGYINNAGQPASDPTAMRSKNFVRIVPNTIYYGKSPVPMGIRFYDENQTFVGTASVSNATFTAPSNAQYLKFYCANTATYNNDISINYPSTDHDYHAYTGTTYETDLEQTVYGGDADVVNGTGTSTMGELTIDENTAFGFISATKKAYLDLNTMVRKADYTGSIYCDKLETVPFSNDSTVITSNAWITGYPTGGSSSSGNWLYWGIDGINSRAEMLSWLTNNPLQVIYPLSEPQTLTFTPQTVSLNSGTNNVWSDGYTCVEYMKDKGELTDTLAELQDCCQGGALIVPMTEVLNINLSNYMWTPYNTIYNAYAEGRPVYFKDPQGNFYTASYIGKRGTYDDDVIDLLYFQIDSTGDYYERVTFEKDEDGYPKYQLAV